jgi:hypothetical protein
MSEEGRTRSFSQGSVKASQGDKKKGTEQGKAEQEDKKRRKRRYLGQIRQP